MENTKIHIKKPLFETKKHISSSEPDSVESNNDNIDHQNYQKPCQSNYINFYEEEIPRDSVIKSPSLTFKAMITPLTNIKAMNSNNVNSIEFTLKRFKKIIYLQWEPFQGLLGGNNVQFLSVAQSLDDLPSHKVEHPIKIYCGKYFFSTVEIDPFSNYNIKFYLSESLNPNNKLGDSITIPGGTIHWLIE